MRRICFLFFILISGLIACNSSSDNTTSPDSASGKGTDTSMNHTGDSVKMEATLPPIPTGAKVYFKNLRDGQTVKSPIKVEMGVKNIRVDSAGAIVAGEG